MYKKTLTLTLSVACIGMGLCSCKTWNHNNLDHWEQGKKSAANWKVNSDRDAQGKILVLESVPTRIPLTDANYEETSYNAISHMLATAHPLVGQNEVFDSNRTVLYSTTVDLNDYSQTTNFGRLQAESLATALIQHWQNDLVKMTLRQSSTPIIPQQGEFLLSRDIRALAVDFNAGAVLVSTYSVAIDKVYMNVQLINVDYNTVVAAVSYNMPLGPRTKMMLKDIEMPTELGDFLR